MANTSAFVLAVLKYEGTVATLKGKCRNHEYIEPVEFFESMNKLITDGAIFNPKVSTNNKSSSTSKPLVTVYFVLSVLTFTLYVKDK